MDNIIKVDLIYLNFLRTKFYNFFDVFCGVQTVPKFMIINL